MSSGDTAGEHRRYTKGDTKGDTAGEHRGLIGTRDLKTKDPHPDVAEAGHGVCVVD